MNKKKLSERDICTKFVTPALTRSGKWDLMNQVREEVAFTKGRVIVRGPLAEQKRIVAKVEELMRWCDELEARLTAAESAGAHLLDATLRQLLTPAA